MHKKVREYMTRLGRKGGVARAKRLTKERLSEIGRMGGVSRALAIKKRAREKGKEQST